MFVCLVKNSIPRGGGGGGGGQLAECLFVCLFVCLVKNSVPRGLE